MRIEDDKEFELPFLSFNKVCYTLIRISTSVGAAIGRYGMNLLPASDTKRYAARIIDQSVDEIYANHAHWLTNTVSLSTHHLDKVKLRIKVYFPILERINNFWE